MSLTLVAFKMNSEKAKELQKVCGEYGLTKSKFLRACVHKFLDTGESGREELLEMLGFKRKISWSLE